MMRRDASIYNHPFDSFNGRSVVDLTDIRRHVVWKMDHGIENSCTTRASLAIDYPNVYGEFRNCCMLHIKKFDNKCGQ
jgi:hypothetical protein